MKHTQRPQHSSRASEQLRDDVDAAAIALVASGFRVIDAGVSLLHELTDRGKDELKKSIIRGLSERKPVWPE